MAKTADVAKSWGTAVRCGVPPSDLASALRARASDTDVRQLEAIQGILRGTQDPAIFDAALTIAATEGSSTGARVTALKIAGQQMQPAVHFWLNGSNCQQTATPALGGARRITPSADQIAAIMKLSRRLASERQDEVGAYARCFVDTFEPFAHEQAVPSDLGVIHLCGNKLRLINRSEMEAFFAVRLSPDSQVTGRTDYVLPVHAKDSLDHLTPFAGGVSVAVGTTVLFAGRVTFVGCPPPVIPPMEPKRRKTQQ